jgi:hypothetical protein
MAKATKQTKVKTLKVEAQTPAPPPSPVEEAEIPEPRKPRKLSDWQKHVSLRNRKSQKWKIPV